MTALPDLTGRHDVEVLVRNFYTRAFADPLLGPIFIDVTQMDLNAHLPVMCDFWQTVLFRNNRASALRAHHLGRCLPRTGRWSRPSWLGIGPGHVHRSHLHTSPRGTSRRVEPW